ncbi:class F sortase [Rhodococcus sp. 7Tela_A2]|uniref:class F sortase n=1 Tax=Rhodococcus sp. 7Tela_A2 TaxID=3093744 RepID=UPI003BB66D89
MRARPSITVVCAAARGFVGGCAPPPAPGAPAARGTLPPPQVAPRLGWWVDSAMPGGGSGAIVVTGHVDDVDQGDGFAARFADVREGDELTVSTGDGRAREYRVDRLLSVGKEGNLPLDEINRLDGPETLLLVTCGGEFVGPPLGYANNDFVFAVPTGPVAEVPAP